jgi:hypothetical protein
LNAIAREYEDLQRRLTELNNIEAGIKALIMRESQNYAASSNGTGDDYTDSGGTELARFVLQTLRQANKPLTVEDFKEAADAAKIDFGEKSPGRVLHWALVGMAQGGSVEKVNDKWRIKKED